MGGNYIDFIGLEAQTQTSLPASTPDLTPITATQKPVTTVGDALNNQLSPVLMEDEMAVRKLITAYFDAIGEHDYAGAFAMISAGMTVNFSKQDAEKDHFGIESVQLISFEPYLRLQEPHVNLDLPTVHFVVNLDITPNSIGTWVNGRNERYSGVVKEMGTWIINALETSSEIYDSGKVQDADTGNVTDLLSLSISC